jgi:hypothetical protein
MLMLLPAAILGVLGGILGAAFTEVLLQVVVLFVALKIWLHVAHFIAAVCLQAAKRLFS